MKILVTGGAGFIGSHLIEGLLQKNHDVLCLDDFNSYYDPLTKEGNIAPFLDNEHFTLIRGDILDRKLLDGILPGVEVILHEAAQPGVQISTKDPLKSHRINATGTLNLLESAVKSEVDRFVFASSSSVYGKVRYLPFDEAHQTCPVSPYGVSKLMAEHYCRVFSDLYGLDWVSLRYFTVYGPRMRPDLAMHIFARQALDNEPLTIFGRGDQTRDFTYVDDVCNANFLALTRGKGAYNIGGEQRISILELAEKIIEITGSSSDIRFYEPRMGDALHTHADISKARHELGWEPGISLDQGLRRYITRLTTFR